MLEAVMSISVCFAPLLLKTDLQDVQWYFLVLSEISPFYFLNTNVTICAGKVPVNLINLRFLRLSYQTFIEHHFMPGILCCICFILPLGPSFGGDRTKRSPSEFREDVYQNELKESIDFSVVRTGKYSSSRTWTHSPAQLQLCLGWRDLKSCWSLLLLCA